MLDLCLSSSRCCSTSQHRRVVVSSVGCLDFGLDTTASVDVDVEPVSERMPRFRFNASSPSPAPHVQTLGRLEHCTPGKQSPGAHRYMQYDIDLPSESEGRTYTCDFIVIVWSVTSATLHPDFQRAKPLADQP